MYVYIKEPNMICVKGIKFTLQAKSIEERHAKKRPSTPPNIILEIYF